MCFTNRFPGARTHKKEKKWFDSIPYFSCFLYRVYTPDAVGCHSALHCLPVIGQMLAYQYPVFCKQIYLDPVLLVNPRGTGTCFFSFHTNSALSPHFSFFFPRRSLSYTFLMARTLSRTTNSQPKVNTIRPASSRIITVILLLCFL